MCHLVDLLVNLKGLPSTYDRDLQEDKRGLWESLDLVEAVFSVLIPLLRSVEVVPERAKASFENGLLLATDVAEYLVLKGVPFRQAHEQVGKAVAWCIRKEVFRLQSGGNCYQRQEKTCRPSSMQMFPLPAGRPMGGRALHRLQPSGCARKRNSPVSGGPCPQCPPHRSNYSRSVPLQP